MTKMKGVSCGYVEIFSGHGCSFFFFCCFCSLFVVVCSCIVAIGGREGEREREDPEGIWCYSLVLSASNFVFECLLDTVDPN